MPFAHRLRRTLVSPLGVAAVAAVLLLACIAVAGPPLLGAEAARVDTAALHQGRSGQHLFGTDSLGRDIAARVVVATRFTLQLTLLATVIGLAGGLLLGLAPAVLGRRGGRLVTAAVGVLVAFPGLLFVLFLATVFGVGNKGAVLAIGLALVPQTARLVQNLAAGVTGTDHVAAARILGVGRVRVVARHVLPNIAEPVALFAAQAASGVVLTLSGLSFLGLGVQAPRYDWGRLLDEQLDRIYVNPAGALAPGAAIIFTGMAFALLGEVVAKAADHGTAEHLPPSVPITAPVPARDVLVQADDLRVTFPGGRTPVRGVSFALTPGESVGIVGESGSGKSLTALALAGLVPHPGRVSADALRLAGHDLTARPSPGTCLAMVFQDPAASLNPALRVGRQLAEVAEVHLGASSRAAEARAVDRLAAVGITEPARRARQRPHEHSGGMRQRAMVGMGLMGKPQLIVADEPTTALDMLVQRQVLDLLGEVRAETGVALLLISHDIAVVAQVCERVLVMYAGRIVEELPVEDLAHGAAHPYTRALIGAVPAMDTDRGQQLATIPGRPPEPTDRHSGCAFAPRCPVVQDDCRSTVPSLDGYGAGPGRRVACLHPAPEVLAAEAGR